MKRRRDADLKTLDGLRDFIDDDKYSPDPELRAALLKWVESYFEPKLGLLSRIAKFGVVVPWLGGGRTAALLQTTPAKAMPTTTHSAPASPRRQRSTCSHALPRSLSVAVLWTR